MYDALDQGRMSGAHDTATLEAERSFHFVLGVYVPVLLLPLTWWLTARAHRSARTHRGPGAELAAHDAWALRLFALALVDTLIAAAAILAFAYGQPLAETAPATARALGPESSPFAPQHGSMCDGVWLEAARQVLAPVTLGCTVTAALWLRSRASDDSRKLRWGLVIVPLVAGPVVGLGVAEATCHWLGGWTIGGALLGALAQGATMLVLGLVAMQLAKGELDLCVGERIGTGHASALAAFYALAGVVRLAVLMAALWSLLPELRTAREGGLDALLAGAHGPTGRALVIAVAVVVAPLSEEVLFRGLLLPGLATTMTPSRALLASSALFALFHVPSHGVGALAPGALGLVFGWARLRTGSLAAPILLHAANNLAVTLLATWRLS